MKLKLKKDWHIIIFISFGVLITASVIEFIIYKDWPNRLVFGARQQGIIVNKPAKHIISSPTPTPTIAPLSAEEKQQMYGPCTYLPVIFYHHVQDLKAAADQGHLGLTVGPDIFAGQMNYLKSQGYTTVTMNDLNNFFDTGKPVPEKSIIVSFDDGYNDFEDNVMPVIRPLNFKVVMFLPTGLVGNSGYLTWGQVTSEANSGLVYFANHSWSHANLAANVTGATNEIDTSEKQLADHGLNADMALAYPYGSYANFTIDLLKQRGFRLAFTTEPGSYLCKGQRLTLPRIRVGNANLSAYGL